MDAVDPVRFALAFVFVIGLIGLFAFLLRRYGNGQKFLNGKAASGRLKIIESRWLDTRRRLVLISRDGVEHLLLLAEGRETVVESNIVATKERNADA